MALAKPLYSKVTEALITFFAGPETVRKLAPSNAAARLLGGDTIHALCKLPFGNARLRSKAGKLAAHTLRQHRKKWETAIACFLDEISMISADQFLQADVRMRQAKQEPEFVFWSSWFESVRRFSPVASC